MCRKLSLGGRRCPCSRGERRRAYQRSHYHATKERKKRDASISPLDAEAVAAAIEGGGAAVIDSVMKENQLAAQLCATPALVDLASVSQLSPERREEVLSFHDTMIREQKEQAVGLYQKILDAGTDEEARWKAVDKYETLAQDLGAHVDAAATLRLVNRMEGQGLPSHIDTLAGLSDTIAPFVEKQDFSMRLDVDARLRAGVRHLTHPDLREDFLKMCEKHESGEKITPEEMKNYILKIAGTYEHDDWCEAMKNECLRSDYITNDEEEYRKYSDFDTYLDIEQNGFTQDDADAMMRILHHAARRCGCRAYARIYGSRYREAFQESYKESTGHDHSKSITIDSWKNGSKKRLEETFRNMSTFFPRELIESREKEINGMEVRWQPGTRSYHMSNQFLEKNKNSRPVLYMRDALFMDHPVLSSESNGRHTQFINDDGEVDNQGFRDYLDSLEDEYEKNFEQQSYDMTFPLATPENLKLVQEAIERRENDSDYQISVSKGKVYKVVTDTFTGYDGKERIRVRSQRKVTTGKTYISNVSQITIGVPSEDHIIHEMGHEMERNPQIYLACKNFLYRRTQGLEKQEVNPNDGGKGFELIPDGFYSDYTGRDYENTVHTEVFTTGVEAIFPMHMSRLFVETKRNDGSRIRGNRTENGITKDLGVVETDDGIRVVDTPPTHRYDAEHRQLVLGLLAAVHERPEHQ